VTMKAYVQLALVLASVALAADSNDCDYVKQEVFLRNLSKVQNCWDSATVPQDFVDTLLDTLDTIFEFYPYVDISMNPPSDYFNTVNYTKEMAKLRSRFTGSAEYAIKDVVRPVQEFIKSFRDGHFSLNFFENETSNPFAVVAGGFPFSWDVSNVDDSNAVVYLSTSTYSSFFLDTKTIQTINSMKGVAVDTVDDVPAFKYFSEFYGKYQDMKSKQGSLQYTKYSSSSGFSVLSNPLDDKVLFGKHTVKYSDDAGTTFDFSLGFVNEGNLKSVRGVDYRPSSLISSASIEQERQIYETLKDYTPKPVTNRNTRDNTYVQCVNQDGMNIAVISTFMPEGQMGSMTFINELTGCAELFDKNSDPITLLLPMNGGGSLVLEQLTEIILQPDTDYRMLTAARKTDAVHKILIENEYGTIYADVDNGCRSMDESDLEEMWKNSNEVDDFGDGVTHKRTKKSFISVTQLYNAYADSVMKHPRKPTDFIVATDGFCFSACSVFVLNSIRKGAAIVTGYGSTYPGDTEFVAAQCPSTVISPETYFDDTGAKCAHHGIAFQATFMESYNISAEMKEIIPGDFEIMRIDKHSGYNKSLGISIPDMIPHIKDLHEEFKTKCNPLNKRLFLVDESCKVDDANAKSAGYACGSDGAWNKTECKISTCKIGYTVDFDNNKCVADSCDVRRPPSSSGASIIYPALMLIASIIAFFAL